MENTNMSDCLVKETKRQTQIAEQMQIQWEYLDRLGKVCSQLDERLKPILTEFSNWEWNWSPEVELVPLAAKIKNSNYAIESKINDLESILNRIEL